jgi:uncharacterized phiE125 gp8 family phage protein
MLTLIDPPTDQIFTLAEAKAFLRVDVDDDDDLINALIAAATSRLDGASGILGRCLNPQRWRWDLSDFPEGVINQWQDLSLHHRFVTGALKLPLPPTIEVEQIQYYDTNGTLTTWASTLWRSISGGWHGAIVVPVIGQYWPLTYTGPLPDKVQVTFRAGYSDTASPSATVHAIPEAIRLAARLLIGDWYDNRLNTAVGVTIDEYPNAVNALLTPYRVVPVA